MAAAAVHQENCSVGGVGVTGSRSAKKRAMASQSQQQPPNKKNRVVLGQLSNNSDRFQNHTDNNKCGSKKKKASLTTTQVEKHDLRQTVVVEDDESFSEDPQMCETYVSDICEYLHTMETPNLQLEFLSYYLAELSLLEYSCIKFLPSMVAASVMFLARFMLKPKSHPWNMTLEQLSGYKPSDLKECVELLFDLQSSRRAGNLVAIREKYKQHKACTTIAVTIGCVIPVVNLIKLMKFFTFEWQFKCVSELSSPMPIPASFFGDIRE